MGILKTEVEKAQREIEKNKAIVDKFQAEEQAKAKAEADRLLETQNREREFQYQCQVYLINRPPFERFLGLLQWISSHPGNRVLQSDGSFKVVSLDELTTAFRVKKLVDALNLLDEPGQTKPDEN